MTDTPPSSDRRRAVADLFLCGSGELTRLIRAFDWSTTPLGPIEDWTQSLRTATGLLLLSPVPMVMLWGQDGTMIYNDAYSMFAGGRHPALLGSRVREGWPEVADFNDNVMRVGLAGGTLSYKDQELILFRGGAPERVWMNLDYSPVLGDGGEPEGVISIVVETTERILAERRASAERERQRLHLLRMPGFVGLLTGPDHVFEYVNDAYVSIAGRRDFIGRGVRDVFPELAGQGFYELLDEVYASGEPFSALAMPIRLVGEDDDRFIDLLYHPVRDDAGGIVGIFVGGYDATGQVRAKRELLEANRDLEERIAVALRDQALTEEALRQSQKMEAVGQLTGGLAHDFNNLLTGIAGSLEMLEIRVKQGRLTEIEKYIVTAQGASKRAAALTHRLLAFSRRQTLDPRPTDVARLVVGMADLIRRTVGPEITVETVNMTGLWTALVDPNQLENALLNLCINARDAMPDGGRLTIETGNKWMDDRAARERDMPPGQYLSLCVSDSGTGMSAEVVLRAFDPFFTTKPLGMGTGLGLSMIYGFARQSGGSVRIYSEVGHGTMVCIYLPRHYGLEEAAEAPAGAAVPVRAEQGETVLVVDDEPSVRMLVTEVLADLGYAAVEAQDGPAGLKVLQSEQRVDLLITDVGLPGGMNGRQVADAARAVRPKLKVLFITGYAENAVVGNGHLDPGMAVLTKPFAVNDLAEKIRWLVEG